MRKIFIYFLSISFLLMVNGFHHFHKMIANAKELDSPIGEMVSRGEVKFEVRENIWKNVEPSHFPIFQGVKIKTEKGSSIITLNDRSQIHLGPHTLLSFDQGDRIHLLQGNIDFRISSISALGFKIGHLSIIHSSSFQVSKKPMAIPSKSNETVGSISFHPNGSVTIKSLQGTLTVVNQDHIVLSSIPSKDSVTLPSSRLKDSSKIIAQAGETREETREETPQDYTWYYVAGGAVAAAAIGVGVWLGTRGDGDHDWIPLCP